MVNERFPLRMESMHFENDKLVRARDFDSSGFFSSKCVIGITLFVQEGAKAYNCILQLKLIDQDGLGCGA